MPPSTNTIRAFETFTTSGGSIAELRCWNAPAATGRFEVAILSASVVILCQWICLSTGQGEVRGRVAHDHHQHGTKLLASECRVLAEYPLHLLWQAHHPRN